MLGFDTDAAWTWFTNKSCTTCNKTTFNAYLSKSINVTSFTDSASYGGYGVVQGNFSNETIYLNSTAVNGSASKVLLVNKS